MRFISNRTCLFVINDEYNIHIMCMCITYEHGVSIEDKHGGW